MILINIFITLKCHLIFKPLWNWDIIFIPLKSAGLNHVLNNKYLLQFKCDAVVVFIRQKNVHLNRAVQFYSPGGFSVK